LGIILCWKRKIYIICERGVDARDNGYHLFKYIVEHHPKAEVYYIIDNNSVDFHKVKKIGRTIEYMSWKHVLYFVAARVKISTHVMGYAPGTPWRFQKIRRFIKVPGKHVFLQHGVTKDAPASLFAEQTGVDLFICGAKPEFEYVNRCFGYPRGVVRYTGLARFDNLHMHTPKREILVMPTWRMYLSNLTNEEFCESDYFKSWNKLLNNPQLAMMLERNEMKLIFYPHYEMQKFINCFRTTNPRIIVASIDKYDVQRLLINARLLITDYSSVFFDFAYMRKPCIYYQFDQNDFYMRQYDKGYFDYLKDGFGDLTTNIQDLMNAMNRIIESGFVPRKCYIDNMNYFFELYDNRNCERIFEAIESL